MKARLQLVPEPPRFSPPTRGELLSAKRIQAQLLDAGVAVSLEWIKHRVPHRVVLSPRRYCWYQQDVSNWIESRRAS